MEEGQRECRLTNCSSGRVDDNVPSSYIGARRSAQPLGSMGTAAQVWDVLAPFVAAGLASWLTYHFALRQRRGEILIEQRLAAFNSLQAVLVGLVHYCEFKHHPGDDI